jgi:hypothetical protein
MIAGLSLPNALGARNFGLKLVAGWGSERIDEAVPMFMKQTAPQSRVDGFC